MKGSVTPRALEAGAEQALTSERCEEADARYGRREHERQLDQRDGERTANEPMCGEQVGSRGAEEQDQRLRDHARLDADDERVLDHRVRELVEQLAGRGVDEDPDDRQREERERDDDDRDEEANPRPRPICSADLSFHARAGSEAAHLPPDRPRRARAR